MRDGELLLLAVLFAEEKDSDLPTFTILTTGASEAVRSINHRLPVMIPRARLDEWLLEGGAGLLASAPADLLAATEVSKRVDTGAEGPACWERDSAADHAALQEALRLFPRPTATGRPEA